MFLCLPSLNHKPKTNYAPSFDTPFKYYDTFATRDTHGHALGLPLFPYFGVDGESRRTMLRSSSSSPIPIPNPHLNSKGGKGQGKKGTKGQGGAMIPVSSCWGGIIAFRAEPFQGGVPLPASVLAYSSTPPPSSSSSPSTSTPSTSPSSTTSTPTTERGHADRQEAKRDPQKGLTPLRFRSAREPYWEASECCLIHSDLRQGLLRLPPSAPASSSRTDPPAPRTPQTYVNPYVRTAYTHATFRFLELGRRVEWALRPVSVGVNWAVGLPRGNGRRAARSGGGDAEGEEEEEEKRAEGEWVEIYGPHPQREHLPSAHQKPASPAREGEEVLDPRGGFCGFTASMAMNEETRRWYFIEVPPAWVARVRAEWREAGVVLRRWVRM